MEKILIHPKANTRAVNAQIKAAGFEPVVTEDQKADTILKEAADVSGIVMMADPFPNEMFDKMPNLKIIARYGVGYDNIDTKYATEHGVWVTNTPGGNAVEVAENTVSDMLVLSKHLYTTSKEMRDGNWAYANNHPASELTGKTVGIVGFGHIGQKVAKMLSGFDTKTLFWNRSKRESPYAKQVDWETLFKESDYISLHLPAVKATVGAVGEKEFKMMKDSAFLVNFARGPVVDEPEMIKALQNHEIAGAGLDVFDTEPLPMDSPLRKLDNVFLTPHCAGDSVEAGRAISKLATENVIEVLNGNKPLTPVNEVK